LATSYRELTTAWQWHCWTTTARCAEDCANGDSE